MDPRKFSLFQTYDKPKGYRSSGSFATFMIIGPVCFFLGVLFSAFPYDYPLLWTSAPTPPEYYDQLETHLKHLHSSPPIVIRSLQSVIGVGFTGFFIKLFKPSEANLLFDGSSLILYVVGVIVFISNILKGFRIVSLGVYETADHAEDEKPLNREDSLKVLAASNTILALVLVGVLVLQAGLWYAEKREAAEVEKFEEDEKRSAAAAAAAKGAVVKNGGRETRSASGKKKQ